MRFFPASGTREDLIIFWMLAFAALLTAFYTARQITLTFLGKPRTEGAAHAPESNKAA
jgi:NADH-quinone oxidoreductase subunit L